VTVSFWAKAATGTPKIGIELAQNFGTGGSPSAQVNTLAGTVTISTSWARYTATVALPSLAGKTIGSNQGQVNATFWVSAGTDFNARTGSVGIQSNTFDIWGVQVEAGSIATPFQTATGTIQGELAACERYYYRLTFHAGAQRFGVGLNDTTTSATLTIPFPITMRTNPSALEQSGTAGDYSVYNSPGITVCSSVPTFQTASRAQSVIVLPVASGLIAGTVALGRNVNTSTYLAWSAEL
jgi:hypothetical protein